MKTKGASRFMGGFNPMPSERSVDNEANVATAASTSSSGGGVMSFFQKKQAAQVA